MSLIIGVNAHHADASACILNDGRIIAAAEEERFRRIKHWAGFPTRAIEYCLIEAGVTLAQIDHLAINANPKAQFWRKAKYALSTAASFSLLKDRWNQNRKKLSLRQELQQAGLPGEFQGRVVWVEHHAAHLASAFYASPFVEASVVSVDGFGDFCSTAWGRGDTDQIDIQGRIFFPHSLGIFYQALTQYLGFPNYGDEYKVMGLAPYGQPVHVDRLREVVGLKGDGSFELDLRFFRHHQYRTTGDFKDGCPSVEQLFSEELEILLGPARMQREPIEQRHCDVARSVQAVYEETFFHLLSAIYEAQGVDAIALAGGCAMNSVANGKIANATPFRRIFIQPAGGDAGGAMGAALHVANEIGELARQDLVAGKHARSGAAQLRISIMDHAYWGPAASEQEVRQLLRQSVSRLEEAGCSSAYVEDELELCEFIAQRLSSGCVVGWFHGRMEWGPRALGNRSVVCDPRNPEIRKVLNNKIKRREGFRPFAPAILREHVTDWFEKDDDVPFMTQVYPVVTERRSIIPAVTHVDGSGRLQTVDRRTNQRFWLLIQKFYELTGVPLVLNTSFNENEPIVCRPEEALDCFLRTRMDLLVLENFIVTRDHEGRGLSSDIRSSRSI